MTPNEAHEYTENEIRCIQRSKICDRDCAKCELVKEDKPLIEAYGVAVLAIEKQIPKKPIPYFSDEYKCPICDSIVNLSSGYKQPFCYQCGQKIDWSDTE